MISRLQVVNYPAFQHAEVAVKILRDDLLHPVISGNKFRKLKYQIPEAIYQGKSNLVTFGGAFSNHVLAVACAASQNGLSSYAFIRGDELSGENHVLLLCKYFGMKLHFVSREDYNKKRELFNSHFGADPDAYFIEEGGSNTLAVKGCREIVSTLNESFDNIICAAGTGGTAAGIAIESFKQSPATKVYAISALKGGEFLKDEIERLAGCQLPNLNLQTNFHCGGYAKTSNELMRFIYHFLDCTGILLDPIYTGKMMWALKSLVEAKEIKKNSSVLCIHTGGIIGGLSLLAKSVK